MATLTLSEALLYSLLGLLVVFFALCLLIAIIKVLTIEPKKPQVQSASPAPDGAAAAAAPAAAPATKARPLAPGTAGELKLYDTEPRDAAMIMAIVADELGAPLNELRFISIREVK